MEPFVIVQNEETVQTIWLMCVKWSYCICAVFFLLYVYCIERFDVLAQTLGIHMTRVMTQEEFEGFWSHIMIVLNFERVSVRVE
jgi:branched-subunit amino acid transport protein AzlD